jgi:hypothetical protein
MLYVMQFRPAIHMQEKTRGPWKGAFAELKKIATFFRPKIAKKEAQIFLSAPDFFTRRARSIFLRRCNYGKVAALPAVRLRSGRSAFESRQESKYQTASVLSGLGRYTANN